MLNSNKLWLRFKRLPRRLQAAAATVRRGLSSRARRWAARRAVQREACRARADLVDLLEKAQQSLPLPQARLSSKCRAIRSDPRLMIRLGIEYDQMRSSDAWLDFWDQIESLRFDIEGQILAGIVNERGEDITPLARATLRMLISVMTIPEVVKRQCAQYEQMQGFPPPIDKVP